jgi:methionyl-tRNA synthetase
LQEYRLDQAAQHIWNEIARLNQEVARGKPWEILKSGKTTELHEVLGRWIDGIHRVAIDLRPFLPETSQKMIDALNTRPIQAAKPMFPRIELEMPASRQRPNGGHVVLENITAESVLHDRE